MIPENVKILFAKARENIDAVQLLLGQAHVDIAASRAYYAIFYTAQALLLSKNLTYSSHAAVIAAYGKEFAKTKELDPRFHQYLILSQSERNLADYGIGGAVSGEDVKKMLAWAEEFLNAAEAYLVSA